MNRTDLFLAIATVLIAFAAIYSFVPEHHRCTRSQLESIGRAGGTLSPGSCDNLHNYLQSFPSNTPLSEVAEYEN